RSSPPAEPGADPFGDALVHFGDRDAAPSGAEQQASEFANVPRHRPDHDAAVVLDDEAQAIAGVDAEVLPHFSRDRDLALGRQRRGRHRPSLRNSTYLTSW